MQNTEELDQLSACSQIQQGTNVPVLLLACTPTVRIPVATPVPSPATIAVVTPIAAPIATTLILQMELCLSSVCESRVKCSCRNFTAGGVLGGAIALLNCELLESSVRTQRTNEGRIGQVITVPFPSVFLGNKVFSIHIRLCLSLPTGKENTTDTTAADLSGLSSALYFQQNKLQHPAADYVSRSIPQLLLHVLCHRTHRIVPLKAFVSDPLQAVSTPPLNMPSCPRSEVDTLPSQENGIPFSPSTRSMTCIQNGTVDAR